MDVLLINYHDPLFAILLIAGIVFVIAFVSYWWGVYVKGRKSLKLEHFLRRFETHGVKKSLEKIPYTLAIVEPMALLAKAYEKSGEYAEAIEIITYLLEHGEDDTMRYTLMELMGSTYMRAGFLERAQSIFLEILHTQPRNKRVLSLLMITYERLHDFKKAKEVIEPLKTLGSNVDDLKIYLDLKIILSDADLNDDKKADMVIDLYTRHKKYTRTVFEYLLKHAPQKTWEMVKEEDIEKLIDILWFLPSSFLDFDHIKQSPKLRALYGARGDIAPTRHKEWFLIDMLGHLKNTGFKEATLQFTYLCSNCKHQFPVPFERCPQCMALDSIIVEREITKAANEASYNLL